jgi:hypothetical protein
VSGWRRVAPGEYEQRRLGRVERVKRLCSASTSGWIANVGRRQIGEADSKGAAMALAEGHGRMKTTMTVYRPGQIDERVEVDLPERPGLFALRAALEPYLDGGEAEHVYVLAHGRAADMFVDEFGHDKRLPRNETATRLYRASWLSRNPGAAPETLPFIVGPAVLFNRKVWF